MDNKTLSLDFDGNRDDSADQVTDLDWPLQERFPLNVRNRQVYDQLLRDARASTEVLIVTGYSGLDQLIDFFYELPESSHIRLLLGNEPSPAKKQDFSVQGQRLSSEIEAHWLGKGISILKSEKLLHCIERLESGRIQAALMPGYPALHAKIYVTDSAAILGSSNFSYSGLCKQQEANVRFCREREHQHFRETQQIAENYWKLAKDYTGDLIQLLRKLVSVVSWQEALARACAELLEGAWAEGYLTRETLGVEGELWPSQRQGIALALQVLDQQGSVLVADATGSGKTRMGAHLIAAVREHIIRSSRLRHGTALMICPPLVKPSWEREAVGCHSSLDVHSHGQLSHSQNNKDRGHLQATLQRIQILCIDEGHNFLNQRSKRSQALLNNLADHVLVFTATPINRGAIDLIRIANLLGSDNLEPDVVDTFNRLLASPRPSRELPHGDIEMIRRQIERFTVRRTKTQLNQLVDEAPDRYRDYRNELCRYPEHNPTFYLLNESLEDRQLAKQICELADTLYAVSYFTKPIDYPESFRRRGVSKEQYLESRLKSAKHLSRYQITSCLRSSRAALVEHIAGTQAAIQYFELDRTFKQTATGNLLATLENLAGRTPPNHLGISLPEWLSNPDAHRAACSHDLKVYTQILECVKRMSSERELRKAKSLLLALNKHQLVLAFDSKPISLMVIANAIRQQSRHAKIMIGTGGSASDKAKLMHAFKPGSTLKKAIGLCSDSLSEGVNLQQASAVMHLDMPSVVRIAEQRVGRVDRMDSPHKSIDVWWPEDAPEFAVSADERFYSRMELVGDLLGSNLPLPNDGLKLKPATSRELMEEYRRLSEQASWDGIHDAFEPVRRMVQGEKPLIPHDIYQHYRTVTTTVLARVSLVSSKTPWALFCLSAGSFKTPRWVFMDDLAQPDFDLTSICESLRVRLTDDTKDLKLDAHQARQLGIYMERLITSERKLLSRRKQRALEEMELIIGSIAHQASRERDQALLDGLQRLLRTLQSPDPEWPLDWDGIAARWLDLIRPDWYDKMLHDPRKLLLLKDLRQNLIQKGLPFGQQIVAAFSHLPLSAPLSERIKACIIGVDRG